MDASLQDSFDFSESISAFRRKKVELAEAPEFVQRLTSFLEVEIGRSASFVGRFKSLPEVKVAWFKDEEQLDAGGGGGGGGGGGSKHVFECVSESGVASLTIRHVNRKDEGAYKCRVENQLGAATTTGYLSVLASKSRGRKSARRKCAAERVSSPPLLKPIEEQRSVEESEEREYDVMDPSPLRLFMSNIRHSANAQNQAPIVYAILQEQQEDHVMAALEDAEADADDEEVFRVEAKIPRSSDEDETSTGDLSPSSSSSSSAEEQTPPVDRPSLRRMLGLGGRQEMEISRFVPVHPPETSTTQVSPHYQQLQQQQQQQQRQRQQQQQHLHLRAPASVPHGDLRSRLDDHQQQQQQQQQTSFLKSPLSSESRPLVFFDSQERTPAIHSQDKNRDNDENDTTAATTTTTTTTDNNNNNNNNNSNDSGGGGVVVVVPLCFLAAFLAVATFVSIELSLSPSDVVLLVGATSLLFIIITTTTTAASTE